MSTTTMSPDNMRDSIRSSWGWLLFLGILFIIGGILSFLSPFIATLLVTTFIGVAWIIVGAMQLVQAWRMRATGGLWWHLIMGLALLAGGIAIYINPVVGALWLTVFVGAAFVVKGVFQIMAGAQMRPHEGSGWMILAGVIAIVVGLLILIQWPLSTAYAIGTLAGISLLFTGWSYVMLAVAGRRAFA